MTRVLCRRESDAEQQVPRAVPAAGLTERRQQQRKRTRGLCRGERGGRDPADNNRAERRERKSPRIERSAERHAATASALDQNESGQSGPARLAHGEQQQRLSEARDE